LTNFASFNLFFGATMHKNDFRLAIIGGGTGNAPSPELNRLMQLVQPLGSAEPAPRELLVCGWISRVGELTSFVAALKNSGALISVISDALVYPPQLKPELKKVYGQFHEEQLHVIKVGYVAAHIDHRGYNRAENSAALCLIIGRGSDKRILVIDRNTKPYGLALPSGFWQISAENLSGCACRETQQETGVVVDPSWLFRESYNYSDPDMDPRDNVSETILGCHVETPSIITEMERQIQPNLREVKSVDFLTLDEFKSGPVAFARHLDASEWFWRRIN
jgi:ADP-ribose pyrophosphatase YjhB (NUDIX family)